MALGLLERALDPGLLTSVVTCVGLIERVALFFEFLPRTTRALVVALVIPAALHVASLNLFV